MTRPEKPAAAAWRASSCIRRRGAPPVIRSNFTSRFSASGSVGGSFADATPVVFAVFMNFYSQDGNGQSGTTNGGSYSNCSDRSQPGVSAVDAFLGTLSYKTFNTGDCAPGHYYLLNNYTPATTWTAR
jgi:hypothetical protein